MYVLRYVYNMAQGREVNGIRYPHSRRFIPGKQTRKFISFLGRLIPGKISQRMGIVAKFLRELFSYKPGEKKITWIRTTLTSDTGTY